MHFNELQAGVHLTADELEVAEEFVSTGILPYYSGDLLVVGGRTKLHWVGLEIYDQKCGNLPTEARRYWYHFLNDRARELGYNSAQMTDLLINEIPQDAPEEVYKFLHYSFVGADLDLMVCQFGIPEHIPIEHIDTRKSTGLIIDMFDRGTPSNLIARRNRRDSIYD